MFSSFRSMQMQEDHLNASHMVHHVSSSSRIARFLLQAPFLAIGQEPIASNFAIAANGK